MEMTRSEIIPSMQETQTNHKCEIKKKWRLSEFCTGQSHLDTNCFTSKYCLLACAIMQREREREKEREREGGGGGGRSEKETDRQTEVIK